MSRWKLAPPKGPPASLVPKPLVTTFPHDLPYVRESRFCGNCKFFVPLEEGQQRILRSGFWDRAFGQFGDGTDFKPYHFCDLAAYSICEQNGAKVHYFAKPCRRYKKCPFSKGKLDK